MIRFLWPEDCYDLRRWLAWRWNLITYDTPWLRVRAHGCRLVGMTVTWSTVEVKDGN